MSVECYLALCSMTPVTELPLTVVKTGSLLDTVYADELLLKHWSLCLYISSLSWKSQSVKEKILFVVDFLFGWCLFLQQQAKRENQVVAVQKFVTA